MLYAIFETVFGNLHRPPFWSITPDFVMELGQAYLSLLALKSFREKIS